MGWQVTAEMVVVPADTQFGRQMVHVNRHGLLPDGVPQDRIKHLLSVRMIRRVGAPAPTLPDPAAGPSTVSTRVSDGSPVVDVDDVPEPAAPVDSVPYADPERVAARAKLPADGSLPDGRAAHAVWVEAAVRAGYGFDAARQSTKAELQDLLRR